MNKLLNSHVNLLPLINSKFNEYKSDLKFVESAACATLAIASPTVYSSVIIQGINGFICNNAADMGEVLISMKKNPEKMKQIALEGKKWCAKNRLQYMQTKERLEWYNSLWENREELTAKLLERVPELAN